MPISNENTRELIEVQTRLARIEQQQVSLEEKFQRLQLASDNQSEELRVGYVSKAEFLLQMENHRLTISLLRTTVDSLSTHIEKLETTIVSEVKTVAKQQQDQQTASLKRMIAIQSAILLTILAAFLAVAVPFLLHHP